MFNLISGTPASNMVLVAASYAQVNLQHEECKQNMELLLENKVTLKTPLSILNFISQKNSNLLGKNKAQVLQWVMYALGNFFEIAKLLLSCERFRF